jgi:hypothetical protein
MKAGWFRTTAILVVFFLASTAANSYETLGWKISWTASTEGNSSIAWDNDVVTHIERYELAGSVSENSQGSYLIDANGYVIEGSSSGSRTHTLDRNHLNWRCGAGDTLQHVDTRGQSHESESLVGPQVGDGIFVGEFADATTGASMASFGINFSCSGTRTYSHTSFNPGTCVPQNSSGADPINQCTAPFWASPQEVEAEDDTKLIFSGTGSRTVDWIFNDQSYVTGYPGTVPTGPVIVSWTTEIERIVVPGIHGIELTQATQIYQPLDELKVYLDDSGGDPPVPLVANKRLAIRVMLEQPLKTVDVQIEAFWNDASLGDPITLTQSENCWPPDDTADTFGSSRENLSPDCRTADFIVDEPGVGLNNLRVALSTDASELVSEEELTVRTNMTDTVVIGAVSVCSARTSSSGGWDCVRNPAPKLHRAASLMRAIYPTDTITVQPTGHQIRLAIVDGTVADPEYPVDRDEADCYDRYGAKVFNGHYESGELVVDGWNPPTSRIVSCELSIWWDVAALRINRLYGAFERTLEWLGGDQWFFYGLVNHNPIFCIPGPGCVTGSAFYVPENPGDPLVRGALGVAEGPEWSIDFVRENVAHEIAHLTGRRHTNKPADPSIFGCFMAKDPNTDYPASYPNSGLYSGDPTPTGGPIKEETGFDAKRRTIRSVFHYRDIMSYCKPRWITPHTYTKIFDVLHGPQSSAVTTGSASIADAAALQDEAGTFWLVSGFVDDAAVYLDSIYSIETIGRAEIGVGTHRIEVLDSNDDVLVTRNFTPITPRTDVSNDGDMRVGLASFAELVPVRPLAAKIVVRNATNVVIADRPLVGATPTIGLVFPIGGEQLERQQDILWNATDADSAADDLVYWVQYSPDGGNRWITLAQDVPETSLTVDFDQVPGSSNALIRIFGSDGVNTGVSTSAVFSVSRKVPTAEIALPENSQSKAVGERIFFEGFGYDLDDGILPAQGHVWTSDRDGWLATGKEFAASNLSEGTHRIELTVTDSDGNAATASVTLNVGAPSDADGDGVADGVDQCPGTPAGEAVDNNGCAASQRDGDNDGVNDALDMCPGTPAGAAVNNSGCTISKPPGGGSSGGGGSTGLVELFILWLLTGLRGTGIPKHIDPRSASG